MPPMTTSTAITLKLLRSTGCYAMFAGSKALGTTNTNDPAQAAKYAAERFPGRPVVFGATRGTRTP